MRGLLRPGLSRAGLLRPSVAGGWGGIVDEAFDIAFGGALLPVRDHVAADAYDDGVFTLPNRLGAGYPPAYVQADPLKKPTIETANGIVWLKSEPPASPVGDGSDAQLLRTSSNYDARDTDVFVVIKRLSNDQYGAHWVAGESTFKCVGFRNAGVDGAISTFNILGGVTAGTVSTPADTWMVLHLSIKGAAPAHSFYRAYSRDGALIDASEKDNAPSGADLPILLGSISGGGVDDGSNCGISRMLVYSHDGGIPSDEQRAAIIAEHCNEARALEGE